MTHAEWRARLTTEQYHILREKGTERAFTGEYVDEKRSGTYRCAGCGAELFASATKYESGSGWPSFWQPAESGAIAFERDGGFAAAQIQRAVPNSEALRARRLQRLRSRALQQRARQATHP